MANRVSVYKIYIEPIISYAVSAWAPLLKPVKWKDIEAVQNIVMRIITRAYYLTSNEMFRRTIGIEPNK